MRNIFLKVVTILTPILLLLGYRRRRAAKKSDTNHNQHAETNGEVRFYMMRHGKTMLNMLNRVQGWSDAFLTPDGEEVARAAGIGLKDTAFTAAYSSDSGRAVQTARIILNENEAATNMELKTDKRLREFSFGSFEGDLNETVIRAVAKRKGQTLEEFQRTGSTPKDYANRVAELEKENRNGKDGIWPAEDYNRIATRLHNAIHEIAEAESKGGGGNVLIVSHGLSLRTLFDMLSEDFVFQSSSLDNASVSLLRYKDGVFSLETVNDLQYAEAGKRYLH